MTRLGSWIDEEYRYAEDYIVEYRADCGSYAENQKRTKQLFDCAKKWDGHLKVRFHKANSPENLALIFAIKPVFVANFVEDVSELEFVVSCQRAEEIPISK